MALSVNPPLPPCPRDPLCPFRCQDTRIGLVGLVERLWGATAAVPGGPRPDVWKAHLLGEWGVVFSGAAGSAFAYEREKSELLFFLPPLPRSLLAPQELMLSIVDGQWGACWVAWGMCACAS
jgi:hypothetical protein